MKHLFLIMFLMLGPISYGQMVGDNRIQQIQNQLEVLQVENTGLSEKLKLDINIRGVALTDFLLAISEVHQININVDPDLQDISVVNNFSDVTVADLLVFLCKEFDLDIEFTGNILSVGKYVPEPEPIVEKPLIITYDPRNETISLDLNGGPLHKTFRKIIDLTGHNLLYGEGMENMPLTLYLKSVPFEVAMGKLAETNGLVHSKSRDGLHLFKRWEGSVNGPVPDTKRSMPFYTNSGIMDYQVVDTLGRIINVDLDNIPVSNLVQVLAIDLDLDYYMATPLSEAGSVSIKAKEIYFDDLLTKIFERTSKEEVGTKHNGRNMEGGPSNSMGQVPSNSRTTSPFTFKREDDIYYFGTTDQLSVRHFEVVQMMHRSVELLADPTTSRGFSRTAGRTVGGSMNYQGNGLQSIGRTGANLGNMPQNPMAQRTMNAPNSQPGEFGKAIGSILDILPEEAITGLDIKVDFELNSFLVSGPATNLERFKKFIRKIDQPVPVVLIEVMLIEVRKLATVETGISWGLGDGPSKTKGGIFPKADITLGAKTVNKIIGGFDGFGSFNIGKVVPEFFATIKAMEENGNIKIRSTPKLSTLNGHRANLSIGETTYYVVTSQNFFGSQIPTASEIRNYQPIDAELAVSIKPLVSGNGQVTLDINVIQSDFSGERIEADAPPGLTSREFSSIIRMQDQDLAVLGGLEEKIKKDTGTGVPLLARIPVIKWLFSQRRREDSKQKLTILIKPTVIY
jgi:type IV pilus assembly protein PilQ